MLKRQVLRTIQSGKEKEWYSAVTNAALYMAIGGFLDEANQLLKNLWKHNLEHDRTTWLADRAFEMLWYASGNRPTTVPFPQISINELEIAHRAYCSGDKYAYEMPKVSLDQLTGLDAYRQASILASIRDNKLPETKVELISLQLLKKSLEEVDVKGFPVDIAVSLAAELAARNNQNDLAIQIIKLWAAKRFDHLSGYELSLTAASRHVAPLLLKGIIADELRLTKESCGDFVRKAISAIDSQMKAGPSLVFGDLTWGQLLKRLSELSIKKEPGEYTNEQKRQMWIGNEAADEKLIIETEKRLGIELPKDYKDFLKTSNGFSNFPLVNPRLVEVEKLDFSSDAYLNVFDDDDNENGVFNEYLRKAIVISQLPDEQEIWLIPPHRSKPEWGCWFYAFWLPGEYRYRSFRDYIESKIQMLEEEFDE